MMFRYASAATEAAAVADEVSPDASYWPGRQTGRAASRLRTRPFGTFSDDPFSSVASLARTEINASQLSRSWPAHSRSSWVSIPLHCHN